MRVRPPPLRLGAQSVGDPFGSGPPTLTRQKGRDDLNCALTRREDALETARQLEQRRDSGESDGLDGANER